MISCIFIFTILLGFSLTHGDESTIKQFSISSNNYALNLHRRMIAETINVLTSPLSVSTQLALLYLGASGKTAQEIRDSLEYSIKDYEIHQFHQKILNRLLQKNNTYDMKMANVVALRQDFPVTENYRQNAKRFYNASIQEIDIYRSTNTTNTINNWISRTTEGKIPRLLISPLDSYNRLTFLNGISLSQIWPYGFEEYDGYFNANGESLIPLKMMTTVGKFPFLTFIMHGNQIDAVELPCKGGLKILFFLPNATGMDALIKFEQHLTAYDLNIMLRSMSVRNVKVSIPKFKLETAHDIMWSVQFLGIHRSFNYAAELKNISKQNGLYVTKILHKMVLNISAEKNEKSSNGLPIEENFRANKPFLFFIRDSLTDMILFMGRIVNLASK